MNNLITNDPKEIRWEGPLTIEAVLKMDKEEDYGLYQIYGTHFIFGRHSLLYIGSCTEQTFGERISGHYSDWLRHEWEIGIFLGRYTNYKNNAERGEVIKEAEKLLIYFHSPPYNSKDKNDCNGARELRIFNLGRHENLFPEVSVEYCYRAGWLQD